MSIPPVLRTLLTAPGPSGYETTAAAAFREAAGGFTDASAKPAKTWATVGQIQVWNRALSAEEIGKLGGP